MFNIDHLRYRIPTLVHQREITRTTTRLCDESGVSSASPRVLAVRCWPRSFIPLIMISVGTEAALAFFSRFANVPFCFALRFRFEDTSHRPSGCPNSHGCGGPRQTTKGPTKVLQKAHLTTDPVAKPSCFSLGREGPEKRVHRAA